VAPKYYLGEVLQSLSDHERRIRMGNRERGADVRTELTIGLPVKDGERFLGQALDSLLRQRCENWTLMISDNASSDGTRDICEEYRRMDPRISYIRQREDLGAIGNFRYLISRARTKFFAWAASDDIWHESFFDSALSVFQGDPDVGMFFSNMTNIDEQGTCIRCYPSFARFADVDRYISLFNYLLDPETQGKANLWYSVMRLDSVKDFILQFLSSRVASNFASDAAMVAGLLCRTRLAIDERILFHKRLVVDPRHRKSRFPRQPTLLSNYSWDAGYRRAIEYSCTESDFRRFVSSVLEYREKLGMAAASLRADTIQKLIAQMYHEMRTYFGSVRARLRERSCAGGE
jgi:glycosyltransferase involved in cell wall biosynthesis